MKTLSPISGGAVWKLEKHISMTKQMIYRGTDLKDEAGQEEGRDMNTWTRTRNESKYLHSLDTVEPRSTVS